VFARKDTCHCDLNAPEGIVFSPDGNLYVTTFAGNTSTTSDQILIFAGPNRRNPGKFLDKIDLDQVVPNHPELRAVALGLLFAPGRTPLRAH
jgi:DNA-binding beta-propeller fold protein YncE